MWTLLWFLSVFASWKNLPHTAVEINSRRFRAGLLILKKQCIYYSLVGCRVLNYKVCKRDTNCQWKVIEMGTFSAGRRLPVKKFSWVMIPPVGIWPFWNPIPYVVSVSNRVIARKLERDQKKMEGVGGGGSYTNFDNFLGELGGKACSVG